MNHNRQLLEKCCNYIIYRHFPIPKKLMLLGPISKYERTVKLAKTNSGHHNQNSTPSIPKMI